jgi:DNA-binding protein
VISFCYFYQEKGSDGISLKAMGRAINKTVMIAELIKVVP